VAKYVVVFLNATDRRHEYVTVIVKSIEYLVSYFATPKVNTVRDR